MLFKEEEKEKEEEEGEELAVVIIMELERIRNEAVISHISDHCNNRLFDLSNPQIWGSKYSTHPDIRLRYPTQISSSDIQLRYPTQISDLEVGYLGVHFKKIFFLAGYLFYIENFSDYIFFFYV